LFFFLNQALRINQRTDARKKRRGYEITFVNIFRIDGQAGRSRTYSLGKLKPGSYRFELHRCIKQDNICPPSLLLACLLKAIHIYYWLKAYA